MLLSQKRGVIKTMTKDEQDTVTRHETKLVGLSVTVSLDQDLEDGIVEKLREELNNKRHEIASQLEDKGLYLIQVYPDGEWTPDVQFESIVAVEVSTFAAVPEGFVQHTLPAGDYVLVTHTGPESTIGETYDAIREKGIADTRPFDFEYWTDHESLGQQESIIEIYLPINI